MITNKKAVIFDLDGSLVDSMWIWREIDIEYMNRHGYATTREELDAFQAEIEGMSFRETAEWVSSHYNIPRTCEEMMDDWNDMAWDKYEKDVPLKNGVRDFIEGCHKKGIKLGIASSNSRELVENVLNVHGIIHYFECIKTGSDGLPGKPSPAIYLAAAEALQIPPSECLVFEDIVNGIQAGKNAGMTVCAIEDAYSAHQREEKKKLADYYIEDYYGIFN